MRADDRAIHEVRVSVEQSSEVSVALQMVQESLPDALECPASEANIDAVPLAVPVGQVTPGRTRAEDPEDAVQHSLVVVRRPSKQRALRGKEWGKLAPLVVSKLVAAQPCRLPLRFRQRALVIPGTKYYKRFHKSKGRRFITAQNASGLSYRSEESSAFCYAWDDPRGRFA